MLPRSAKIIVCYRVASCDSGLASQSAKLLPTPALTPTPANTVESGRLQLRSRLRLRSPAHNSTIQGCPAAPRRLLGASRFRDMSTCPFIASFLAIELYTAQLAVAGQGFMWNAVPTFPWAFENDLAARSTLVSRCPHCDLTCRFKPSFPTSPHVRLHSSVSMDHTSHLAI